MLKLVLIEEGTFARRISRANASEATKREQLKNNYEILPESQGQNLALTVLHVPYLLEETFARRISRGLHPQKAILRSHPHLQANAPYRKLMPRVIGAS